MEKQLLKIQSEPWIIAEVETVEDAVLGEPDCILINPVTVDGEKWPKYSSDTEVALSSSDIIVIVNASKELTPQILTERSFTQT